jgi:hypothetical protein
VTAEAAVVLPSLVLMAVMLMWGVTVIAGQVRCVDAAREGARAAARGDPEAAVVRAARRAAPAGAEVRVGRDGELVKVRVSAPSPGLGAVPAVLSLRVSAEAAASAEDTVGTFPWEGRW